MIEIVRFTGNEKAGKVIVQCGLSDFYEISYPTGDIEYLGQHMYVACFSPNRKYVAYSSVDYENRWDMELEEYNSVAPGIYIREIETGKTAYFYWEPFESGEGNYLMDRSFMWIEKERFERYIAR